jgi:hypothetical protein
VPKPKKNEAKTDYLKRCTSELIGKENKSADQAYAMCNAYWDEAHSKKAERRPLTLTASLELDLSKDESRPEFHMTAYTGQVLNLGWWGRFVFNVSGMRAKTKMPILREHMRDRIVGWSKKAWADGNNFLISGDFSSSTQDAREVLELAKEGFPWQASVGISPIKIKRLGSEKESAMVNGQKLVGPLEIWLESEVSETSFVSLGADGDTAAIALSGNQDKVQCTLVENTEREIEIMEITLEKIKSEYPDIANALVSEGKIEGMKEGAQAERDRIAAVRAQALPGHERLIEDMVNDGTTTGEQAAVRILQAEKQIRADIKANLDADTKELPKVPPSNPPENEPKVDVSTEAGMKAAWEKDKGLREEFGEDFETFKAYQQAEKEGRFKVLGGMK